MRLVAAVLGRTVQSSPSTAVLLGVAVPEPGCWNPKPTSRLSAGWPRTDATEPWAHVVPLALSLLRGFSLGTLPLGWPNTCGPLPGRQTGLSGKRMLRKEPSHSGLVAARPGPFAPVAWDGSEAPGVPSALSCACPRP